MRPSFADMFRSSAFRTAGLYSVLFVVSLVALLSIVYLKSTSEFRSDLREKIEAETSTLLAIHHKQGVDALIQAIGQRGHSYYYYAVENRAGKRLVDHLGAARLAVGWYGVDIFEDQEDRLAGELTTLEVLGTPLDDGAILAVGAINEGADDLREFILYSSSLVIGFTAVLALVGGLITYRTSMRRIDMIASFSQGIMSGDLTHRLPLNGSGDELDRLSDNINQMIARIEQLMAGMKQVTSDIAHDLRTPLGRLRQKLELARDSECKGIECKAVFELTISEMDGILETFDALLRIGKIDAGAAVRRFAEVDLSEMTARLGESYRPVIEDNMQFLKTSIETGVRVTGDRELLMQMLVNLMENAIRHCRSGTLISLSLSQGDKAALLTIADNGCGVPAEELPKILRPFYRLEQSRSSVGSGLGLALVDAIARLHGIRLDLSDNRPGLKISLAFSNQPNAVLQP